MLTLEALIAEVEKHLAEYTSELDMEYSHWLETEADGTHKLYWRWNDHGASGGSCWKGGGGAENYENEAPTSPLLYILPVFEETAEIPSKAVNAAVGLGSLEKEGCASGYYGNYDHWKLYSVCLEDIIKVVNSLTEEKPEIPN